MTAEVVHDMHQIDVFDVHFAVVVVVVWQAMQSTCSLMGSRTFLNQLTVDTIQHRTHGFTDEIDVSTLKDYMKVAIILSFH